MKLTRAALALSAVGALLAGAVPLQASADPTNLALNRPVSASGSEASFSAARAFDGNPGPADPTPPSVHNDPSASRWSANQSDTQAWISVDLGAPANLEKIRIRWGNQFATKYSLLGSKDGVNWTPLTENLAGAKGTWIETPSTATDVQYVKVQSQTRSGEWGIAIWEIEVFGTMENPPKEQAEVGVVPLPVTAVAGEGAEFRFDGDTNIVADSPAAERLADTLRASTGLPLPVSASGEGEIQFVIDENAEVPGVEREGYLFTSSEEGITITAQTEAGLTYGAETLLQLLGPWSRAEQPVVQDWTVPALDITDGPRYEWRGHMIDPSRSFIPVDEVLDILDQMAAYKMNVLHTHLSDDQGWRIAISNEGRVEGDTVDYSLLTSVSGQTAVTQSNWTNIPGRTGFYTAEDFAEIIAYAAERNIVVIPEIDGPAHAQAILHAIPQANSAGSVPKPAPGSDTAPSNPTTSVGESTLDANNPVTYTILRHVFKQLFEATPSELNGVKYMHIGGDESHSTSNADYRKYISTMAEFSQAEDSTMMVWNEAAGSAGEQLPDGSVIHFWNGNIGTTRNWAQANNGRVLLSPATQTYLPQVPAAGLGGASWACGAAGCNLETYYNWNPTTYLGLTEEHVLGVEAPLWAEHTRSLNSIEFNMYPRLMATAEVGWTPQSRRNVADFRGRLQDVVTSLTANGTNFHPGDGTWRNDVVALQATASTPDAVGEIAWLSSPTSAVANVAATLEIDGDSYAVDVETDRVYASGVGSGSVDNRQASGLFRFTPAEDLPEGSYTGDLTVTIGSATETVEVPFVIDGTAPEVAAVEDVTATVGDPVSIQVTATDATDVSFSAEGLPAGLSIDAATGKITGTLTEAGESEVTVTVTDSLGHTSSITFTITGKAKPTPTPTPTPTKSPSAEPTPSPSAKPTETPGTGFKPSAPYTLPGVHNINGRSWNTTCEPYSQTTRCRTDIWATVVVKGAKGYEVTQGWAFNNLTYLPYMTRSAWATNPLGYTNKWTAQDGRQWMTECDTAATGRGACRSYTLTTVVAATAKKGGGYAFASSNKWVFNNMVIFK